MTPTAIFGLNNVLVRPGSVMTQSVGDAIRVGLEDNFRSVLLTSATVEETEAALGDGVELFDKILCCGGSVDLRRGVLFEYEFPKRLLDLAYTRGYGVTVCGAMLRVCFRPEGRSREWFVRKDANKSVRTHFRNDVEQYHPGHNVLNCGQTHVIVHPHYTDMARQLRYHKHEETVVFAHGLRPLDQRHLLAQRLLRRYGSVHAVRDPDHTARVLRGRRNY